MKTSTKILLLLTLLSLLPATLLFKNILDCISVQDGRFVINLSTLGILGLVSNAIFTVLSTILFVKFLKRQRLASAIFFSVAPLTFMYGAFVLISTDVKEMSGVTAEAIRTTLNITPTTGYNNYLWCALATIVYLFLLFVILMVLCRPLSKVEKVTQKLGDGRIRQDDYKVGGGRQFREIEHSLNKINYNIKQKENKLRQTDLSRNKDINKNFYKFLSKNAVLELECGNPVKKQAVLLHCELVEKSNELSLKENFAFLKSYLGIVTPLISKHGGFVDKYNGNGVLAVFGSAKDATECAQAIMKASKSKKHPINTQLSLHFSPVTFGLIGEEKLPNIVSNESEFLDKMQDINIKLGSKILISKTILNIAKQVNFDYRFVGEVEGSSIYEDLNFYNKRKRDKLKKCRNKFENAVQLFYCKQYEKAKLLFEEVLKVVPDDKIAFYYLNLCAQPNDIVA